MGIGIDLGGTAIKGGLVNDQGEVQKEYAIRTNSHRGYQAIANDMTQLINGLFKEAPDEKTVGIGIPGILSGDGGTVLSCPNLGWKNVPLKKELEAALGKEVLLVNDATAACIAEAAFGSTKGKANSVLLTLGTGVGGGVILNGHVIAGSHGVASEIGHMHMEKNFYDCACGKNGCLETFASATAIIRFCEMKLNQGYESTLRSVRDLDGKAIMDAAQSSDELAAKAVDRMVEYLGWAIANISDLIDPEIYAIGGGLSYTGSFLLEKIRAETKKRLTYPQYALPEIVLATFRNEAGMIGAANLKAFI